MIRVEHYLYLPGCCGICHSVNLPTIDTGIDLDHMNNPDDPNPGANKLLYICADCAIEMARMVLVDRNMELVRAGSNSTLTDTINDLTESNMKHVARIEELENALRIVREVQATPVPASTPAKKQFKVANPDEVEV